MQESSHPFDLPPEVTLHIFSFLDQPRDIANVSLVNKKWNSITSENSLWRGIYKKTWDSPPVPNFMQVLGSPSVSRANSPLHRSKMSDRKAKEEDKKESEEEEEEENGLRQSMKDVFRQKKRLEARWLSGKNPFTHSFIAHEQFPVNALKFVVSSASSSYDEANADAVLVTCSDDKTIKVWRPSGEEEASAEDKRRNKEHRLSNPPPALSCTHTLSAHQSLVWSVDFDGSTIVSASHDESVIVWREGEPVKTFNNVHPGGVNGVIFQQNRALTRGREAKEMSLLDIEKGEAVMTIRQDSTGIFAATASLPNDLAISSTGPIFKCWDLRSGECIGSGSREDQRRARLEVLRLCQGESNNHYLSIGDSEGDCTIWDLRHLSSSSSSGEDKPLVACFNHGLSPICALHFDTTKLVSGSKDGVIRVWNNGLFGGREDSSSRKNFYYSLKDSSNDSQKRDGGRDIDCKLLIHLKRKLWCFQADDRALVCGDRGGAVHILDFGAINEETLRPERRQLLGSGGTSENPPSCSMQ
ncbi:wD repeat domain [Balamuthia mandrillaris]